jgi:hypothetical protein
LEKAIDLAGEIEKAMPVMNKRSTNNNKHFDLTERVRSSWMGWGLTNYQPDRPVTKRELAILLDKVINPFSILAVNHQGNFTST